MVFFNVPVQVQMTEEDLFRAINNAFDPAREGAWRWMKDFSKLVNPTDSLSIAAIVSVGGEVEIEVNRKFGSEFDGQKIVLDRPRLLSGLSAWFEYRIKEGDAYMPHTTADADQIVQFALFGRIVF